MPPFVAANPSSGEGSEGTTQGGYNFQASGGDSLDEMTDEQIELAAKIMLEIGPQSKMTAMTPMNQLKQFGWLLARRGDTTRAVALIDHWVAQAEELFGDGKSGSKAEGSAKGSIGRAERLRLFPTLPSARVHPMSSMMLNTRGEYLMSSTSGQDGGPSNAQVAEAISTFRRASSLPTGGKNLESKAMLARALWHPSSGASQSQVAAAARTCANAARRGSHTHQQCLQIAEQHGGS